ncbi:hypothetical protein N9H60_02570 [Flavimaricola sp.]|nr:hypothetical protein [Flavimaricola sp.]MDA9020044.1 hypothetical protein [Flavimaricola sp.]
MKSGDIYVFSKDGKLTSKYNRQRLSSDSLFDEKWLQQILYENIDLIKVSDPSYDKVRVIPLCRELALNDGIRNIFLDILAVTETGRLVLIECKLWKNPQARREVLAQTLEYASLMQKLSYSDLSAKLKKHIESNSRDPISEMCRSLGIDLDESLLIDRITENMKRGDFHLIIAGDGIRADLVNLVNSNVMRGMTADLSLLEISVHSNARGEILLSPTIPTETETVIRTVLLSAEGMPAIIEEEYEKNSNADLVVDSNRSRGNEAKKANSIFWNRAIEEVKFDHPDQEQLRRGGSNWCKATLPKPLKWITAYRSRDRIGVFLRIDSENIDEYFEFFTGRLEQMRAEISPDISVDIPDQKEGWRKALFVGVTLYGVDTLDPTTESMQINWISDHLNRFVNFLRPIIRELPWHS